MSDDNTPDVPEEPDADLDDPQDGDTVDQQEDHGDETEEVDVAELKTRLDEAEAEAARYKRRLIASDLRKKQVEKKLRELRGTTNKPKPNETHNDASKQQADPRDTELETLRRQVADANVRRQFDRINTYAWQNTDAAYRLLDLTDVRQDDGSVDRDDLQDAVAALAKDNPYLLKTDTPKRVAERPTGQQPGTHRREQKPDKQKLAPRFGALTGRV